MTHLSQDDTPETRRWSGVCHRMLAQGLKRVDKLMQTILKEHTSHESSFKFLKPTGVLGRKLNFCLKMDPDPEFRVKPVTSPVWVTWII